MEIDRIDFRNNFFVFGLDQKDHLTIGFRMSLIYESCSINKFSVPQINNIEPVSDNT